MTQAPSPPELTDTTTATQDTGAAGPDSVTQTKHFVLDTNVLLHNPGSLYMFADNHVIIPFTVLEELDKFKKNNDDTGRNCREVIRQLDKLRAKGPLAEGVEWNGHGGTVRVAFAEDERPAALREEAADNRIISVAWRMHQNALRTILVSKDINVRIKADALGVPAEDFEAQKVDSDRLYRGYAELDVPGELIDQLYEEKQVEFEAVEPPPHPDRCRRGGVGDRGVAQPVRPSA